MSTPYFNRDESIILTAHKVKFDSALSDVMLTSQRIILIDAGYAQFKPQIIPLATIETVIAGEDAVRKPYCHPFSCGSHSWRCNNIKGARFFPGGRDRTPAGMQ